MFCCDCQWFTTVFALSVPVDTASCAVDLILGGFDNVLFRIGAAALVLLESKVHSWTLEDLMLVRYYFVKGRMPVCHTRTLWALAYKCQCVAAPTRCLCLRICVDGLICG